MYNYNTCNIKGENGLTHDIRCQLKINVFHCIPLLSSHFYFTIFIVILDFTDSKPVTNSLIYFVVKINKLYMFIR